MLADRSTEGSDCQELGVAAELSRITSQKGLTVVVLALFNFSNWPFVILRPIAAARAFETLSWNNATGKATYRLPIMFPEQARNSPNNH